jgi:enamine deaminase RidA (YjgF/YER057c/UK114 family)
LTRRLPVVNQIYGERAGAEPPARARRGPGTAQGVLVEIDAIAVLG